MLCRIVFLLALALTACSGRPASRTADRGRVVPVRPVDSLRAFARLYGFVRYFHPSDEAAAIDWERFAVAGADEVMSARDSAELKRKLEHLFLPIAPSAIVYLEGETPAPYRPPMLEPGLRVVAWQHRGMGQPDAQSETYQSVRLNRPTLAGGAGFASISQSVSAAPYRGKRILLRAAVRVGGGPARGQLWLRVDRPGDQHGFFDNMDDRPVTSTEWQTVEVSGPVADDAESIVFGALMSGGPGSVSVDGFELASAAGNGEAAISLVNPGFEEAADPRGWRTTGDGFTFSVTSRAAREGDRALSIERESGPPQVLYQEAPSLDEVVDEPLGGGVRARIPLALLGDERRTLPAPAMPIEPLHRRLAAASTRPGTRAVRLASVVIAWNVFQHFYPYFDVVRTDWAAALDAALGEVLGDQTPEQYRQTLLRLVAALHDGHGGVYGGVDGPAPAGQLPLVAEWIEDRVVVTASAAPGVAAGDVIARIDGRPAAERLAELDTLSSGSPQWRRYRSLGQLGSGPVGARAVVTLERDGVTRDVAIARVDRGTSEAVEFERPAISVLEGGIYYVDLSRASYVEIGSHLAKMAAAPGVVFDLRGYPNGNHFVLHNLLAEPCNHDWMFMPKILYPDRKRITWEGISWNLQPSAPRIRGPVAFITGPMAISYAESVMAHVSGHQLGDIVGAPTAGANGDINPFTLPTGHRITWTGLKVLNHDGSQLHTIGVQPTAPVARTLAGVRAHRDELLEAALARVRARTSSSP